MADLQASVLVLGAKSVLVPAALASFLTFSSFRVSSSLTLSESVPWKPSGRVLFDCVQILFLYEDLQLSLSCKYMMCNYCIRQNTGGAMVYSNSNVYFVQNLPQEPRRWLCVKVPATQTWPRSVDAQSHIKAEHAGVYL